VKNPPSGFSRARCLSSESPARPSQASGPKPCVGFSRGLKFDAMMPKWHCIRSGFVVLKISFKN
jgi:hypothetical protein